MIDIGPKDGIGVDTAFAEGDLHYDRVLVPVFDFALIDTPSKRGVHEELRLGAARLAEARDQLAGVDDAVGAIGSGQPPRLKEVVKALRAGKHLDAFALFEPVPGFLPDDTGVAVNAVFGDHGRRDPHLVDLDAVRGLIFRSVPQPKEIQRPLHVVVVEMREANDIVEVPVSCLERLPKQNWQVAPAVGIVVRAAHIGIVDKDRLAIGQVDPGGIGIADREKRHFSGHFGSSPVAGVRICGIIQLGASTGIRGQRFSCPHMPVLAPKEVSARLQERGC